MNKQNLIIFKLKTFYNILKELDELITIDGYKNISEAVGKSS